MSILDRIADLIRPKSYRPSFSGGGWLSAPEMSGNKQYLNAYSSSYILFGIALRIATAVGEVKWRLYKGSDRSERSQVAEHPIIELLDRANEFQTGGEIMELLELHVDLTGTAYGYFPRNGLGVPGEVWLLPPHQVSIVRSKKDFIAGYIFHNGEEKVPLPKEQVIRFTMPDPVDPYGGVGFVKPLAVELDSERYAAVWNKNFFYNSARPDGVLESENKLSDEEFKRLKEQWEEKYRGLSQAHKVALLEGGLKYKQIQNTIKDMDFVQLRKTARENLLLAFGMPLSVMGITENVNRANAEAGDYVFARWLIKPRLTRIRNKLNEQLLPMFPQAKGVELDFDEVVPETIEQKRALAESGIKSGYMTINESRKLQGLDPVTGGDVFLVPFNLMPTPANKPIEAPQSPKSKLFKTDEQKEAYWHIYAAKALSYERALIPKLKTMFREQEKEALSNLKEGMKPDTPLISQSKAKKDYKELAKPILLSQLEEAINDGEDLISPEPEHRSKQVNPEAVEWLDTKIGWAADEVGEETARLLAVQLKQGFEGGEGIPKIARRVRSVFDYCSTSRAKMIARTETIMASNEGALTGYESSGVVEKAEFYPAPDACDDCLAEVGEYPIEEAHGKIPVHPNCRCCWLPVV